MPLVIVINCIGRSNLIRTAHELKHETLTVDERDARSDHVRLSKTVNGDEVEVELCPFDPAMPHASCVGRCQPTIVVLGYDVADRASFDHVVAQCESARFRCAEVDADLFVAEQTWPGGASREVPVGLGRRVADEAGATYAEFGARWDVDGRAFLDQLVAAAWARARRRASCRALDRRVSFPVERPWVLFVVAAVAHRLLARGESVHALRLASRCFRAVVDHVSSVSPPTVEDVPDRSMQAFGYPPPRAVPDRRHGRSSWFSRVRDWTRSCHSLSWRPPSPPQE